jgi:general stress protein 26
MPEPTVQGSIDEVPKLTEKFSVAMMMTQGQDGRFHSRPMATQKPLPDSPLWFVTEMDSAKVQELQADPRVNLGFFTEKDYSWMSVSGTVRLDQNRQRIRELWEEHWRIWFKDGPDQANLVLLHVDPEFVSYQSNDQGKVLSFLLMAKAYVTGTRPDHDQVKVVELD